MFFERHLENLLKHFIPGTTDPAVILDLLPLCRNYVRRVHVDQFLPPVQLPAQLRPGGQSDSGSEGEMEEPTVDHYQLGDLVAGLSHLEELDLVYDDGGKQLLEGMSDNKTLLEFDLRLSDVAQESEYLIGQALHANREAARQRALNPSHFMSTITANGPENSMG
uniref:T-complex-associated-testis-expressed 1 n=1 Tax=Nomascus leucogenys TaxID=61853 RepID=A0A2I3HS11_NOMLE